MRVRERGGDLAHDRQGLGGGHWTALGLEQAAAQGVALDKVHDDEGGAAVLLEAVEADDVLVGQAGQAVGLRLETPDEVPVLGQVFAQYLDRDRVVAAGVEGMVNLGHAAAAQWFFDAVTMCNGVTDEMRHA